MRLLWDMITIGIRELKAKLSQVLRDVQRGETVLVTDRGRVVAELRAPGDSLRPDSPTDRALARLAADGELRLAHRSPDPYQTSPLSAAAGTGAALLAAERAER